MNRSEKRECLSLLEEITDPEESFTEKVLNVPVTVPVLFHYFFEGGNVDVHSAGQRKTVRRNLYELYEKAEASVTVHTREQLEKVYISHKNYMKACLFISFIKNEDLFVELEPGTVSELKYAPFKEKIDKAHIFNNVEWIEKMFVDQIPTDLILFAATRQLPITGKNDYNAFVTDLQAYPVEWLKQLYPPHLTKQY